MNLNFHLQQVVDPQKCMSRKNKNTGILEQCPHVRKFGHYCGRHGNEEGKLPGVIRIDEDLPAKTIEKISKMQEKNKTEILKISDLSCLGRYNKLVLKNTAKKFGLNINGNKTDLIKTLKNYYLSLIDYIPYENKIILLQKKVKDYLIKKNCELRGPALYQRE